MTITFAIARTIARLRTRLQRASIDARCIVRVTNANALRAQTHCICASEDIRHECCPRSNGALRHFQSGIQAASEAAQRVREWSSGYYSPRLLCISIGATVAGVDDPGRISSHGAKLSAEFPPHRHASRQWITGISQEPRQSGVIRMWIPSTPLTTVVVSPSATHQFIGQF